MIDRKESVARFGESLASDFATNRMVVFLCGPGAAQRPSPGAELRVRLGDALEAAGFEVILGEDDGLGYLQNLYKLYAHDNELRFVEDQAAAIVLVADSVGSFCELGMFADRFARERDKHAERDFILIASDKHATDQSYFNLGPALAVKDFGKAFYEDFAKFDVSEVVDRLARRRTVWKSEARGRPKGR